MTRVKGKTSRLGMTLDTSHPSGCGECMNNPEVAMHENQPPTRFEALEKATTAAGIAITLVMRVPVPLIPVANRNRSKYQN